MTGLVFYLTGMGGTLHTGLGQAILDRGFDVTGRPPRANVLMELAQSGKYPSPKYCEIHTGAEDWQSNPVNVTKFGELVSIPVHVVADGGHMLPKEYVSSVLDRWLK